MTMFRTKRARDHGPRDQKTKGLRVTEAKTSIAELEGQSNEK